MTALLILLLLGNFKATKIVSFSYETNNQYSCKPFIKANYNEIISVDDYIQISFNLVNGTDDYNVLYDTNNINIIRLYENGDGINTLLAEPEWTTILSHNYSYVYWVIFAEQTNAPVTGAYISEPATLTMPSVTSLGLSTIVSHTLGVGDYFWYKLTAYDNGTYTFETTGSTDTYGELFPSLVAGHSTTGRLAFDDDSGLNHNFKITYNLTIGDIVYIRIHGYSWTATGQFSFEITGPNHTHSYDDHYQWTSLTEHKSYCDCGNYILSAHVVSPDAFQGGLTVAPCLLCGGFASFGGTWHDGIGGFPYTLNGSFILPNGVIVLEEADMEAYLNGILVFIYQNDDLLNNYRTYPFLVRKKEQFVFNGGNER